MHCFTIQSISLSVVTAVKTQISRSYNLVLCTMRTFCDYGKSISKCVTLRDLSLRESEIVTVLK
jgi:hypothetical protein